MSDKEEGSDLEEKETDKEEKNTILSPGNLLSFGSLNLTFNLKLKKKNLKKYKINFDSLKELSDLKFILKHKRFLKKIDITSKSSVLSVLLNINKSAKKMIKIGYVCYKKINFAKEQEKFKEFIEKVTHMNGLYLTSCDLCNCTVRIELILNYEKMMKKFVICGDKDDEIKEEKEEDNNSIDEGKNNNENKNKKECALFKKAKDNKYEERNPFVSISKDIVKLGDFDYIYFNYNDYINGEFSSIINISSVYEYFQNIKLISKSKIILNLEGISMENEPLLRDLLSLTDVFIFYDKNKLYEILKTMKEKEDNENTMKLYKYHYLEAEKKYQEKEENQQIEEEKIKKYKLFLEKDKEKNKRFKKLLTIDKRSVTEQNESIYNKSKLYITQEDNDKNKEYEVSEINKIISNEENNEYRKKKEREKKNKLFYMKLTQPQTLNKKKIWDYFKDGIYEKDPQKKYDKIIILMDEFKKIFFVKFSKKNDKPVVTDYDLKLYPKINLQNMKEVLDFKQLLKSKFDEYIKIYIATLLGAVLKNPNIQDNDLLLGYLYATNKIKKLAEIDKYNLPIPKEKKFFYPNLTKKGINQILTQTMYNKKEKSFVLDGNKKKDIGIKQYNPLLDKNLASFFNTRNNQNFLKLKGFINNEGEIIYDPFYKETLRDKKNIIKEIKEDTNTNIIKSFQTTNKFLFGYKKKIPEYSIYNTMNKYNNFILPPITPNKKQQNTIENNNKKDIINEDEDESGSRSNADKSGSNSGIEDDDSGSDNNNEKDEKDESNKNSKGSEK